MEWIFDNWFILVGLAAVLVAVGWACYKFLGLPTKEQVKKIKVWLLWAVSAAEADLGSGTGELKLRMVYDMFVARFPMAAKVVPFETFKVWVDEALDQMKALLETNEAIAAIIVPEMKAEGTE